MLDMASTILSQMKPNKIRRDFTFGFCWVFYWRIHNFIKLSTNDFLMLHYSCYKSGKKPVYKIN